MLVLACWFGFIYIRWPFVGRFVLHPLLTGSLPVPTQLKRSKQSPANYWCHGPPSEQPHQDELIPPLQKKLLQPLLKGALGRLVAWWVRVALGWFVQKNRKATSFNTMLNHGNRIKPGLSSSSGRLATDHLIFQDDFRIMNHDSLWNANQRFIHPTAAS